jgi:pimeloyl-ACP methyl ester carboxylesterase
MDRITAYGHDGLEFDVVDEGPPDGDPVVLLHGFPQRSTSWRRVTPLLHEAGHRTLAPDQRGYSPGARPRRRHDYAVTRMVDDFAALVDAVGQPVHLVGHDWGAAVGWAAAALRPELVRSFTAVSVPHPGAFLESFVRSDQLRRSWYMAVFQLPWLPELLLSGDFGQRFLRSSGMDREEVRRFRDEVVADGALSGGLNWYRGLAFAGPRLARRQVSVPTTLVWSDGDVALGRHGAERTEAFVTGPYTFVELPGVSHWIPEEAPEPLADAILARIDGR